MIALPDMSDEAENERIRAESQAALDMLSDLTPTPSGDWDEEMHADPDSFYYADGGMDEDGTLYCYHCGAPQ